MYERREVCGQREEKKDLNDCLHTNLRRSPNEYILCLLIIRDFQFTYDKNCLDQNHRY